MSIREKLVLGVCSFILALIFNLDFLNWVSLPQMLVMNDVPSIMSGATKVPHLIFDSGRWWTGTWIQDGISAYRPLASYLYWLENWIGLQWGFLWVGWIGVFLLAANSWLSGVLAWRFTHSRACLWLAIILANSLRFFNWGGITPSYWLAWYPVHQELLMNIWLLCAVFYFDVWNETAKRNHLLAAWGFYLLGVFTKEHVYIFPAFALAIVVFRRHYDGIQARVAWRTGMVQVALLFTFVFALWAYRASVLIDPRNPQLKPIHFVRKPFLYVFHPFYRHVLTAQYWFPGLILLLFTWSGFLLRWSKSHSGRLFLQRPFAVPMVLISSLAVLMAYCAMTYGISETFWYLFDPASSRLQLPEVFTLFLTIYTIWLLAKYRMQEPTLAIFVFLVLSYVPVLTYLGWHYTVAAWFIRVVYWALIAKLIWLDVAPVLTFIKQRCSTYLIQRYRRQKAGNSAFSFFIGG